MIPFKSFYGVPIFSEERIDGSFYFLFLCYVFAFLGTDILFNNTFWVFLSFLRNVSVGLVTFFLSLYLLYRWIWYAGASETQ